MSDAMKSKIRSRYANANEIIDFFSRQNNCTLVFTADPFLTRELELQL